MLGAASLAACSSRAFAPSSLVQAQQPATLTIHADQPVSPVSPTLYGLMTEEINYSYDGGLYAEMVRNRTFHSDWSGILYWYLVENGNAAAKDGPRQDHRPQRSPALEPAPRRGKGRREEPGRCTECGLLGFCPATQHHLQGLLLCQGRFNRPRPVTSQPRQRRHRQSDHDGNRSRRRHGLEAVRIQR